jgi:hypothetical protein
MLNKALAYTLLLTIAMTLIANAALQSDGESFTITIGTPRLQELASALPSELLQPLPTPTYKHHK